MRTKTCSKCGKEKSVESFYRDRRLKSGRMARCKRCYLLAIKRRAK